MRLAQSRLGASSPAARSTARPRGPFDPSTPAGVLRLQRTAGNRATSALIARLPYQTAYSESQVRRILNQSEKRLSPVTGAEGHPRQHVGRLGKAEEHAEQEGKTKSVFTSTEQQDKAVKDVLASPAGQAQLALLDAAPAVAARQVINSVETQSTDVLVVKAMKKKRRAGAPAPEAVPGQRFKEGDIKDWEYRSGTATKASVIVESTGSGQPGDIHIQTAYPVVG
jgi:hypothetical protein